MTIAHARPMKKWMYFRADTCVFICDWVAALCYMALFSLLIFFYPIFRDESVAAVLENVPAILYITNYLLFFFVYAILLYTPYRFRKEFVQNITLRKRISVKLTIIYQKKEILNHFLIFVAPLPLGILILYSFTR